MIDSFLTEREGNKSESTIYNNRSHLADFNGWCADNNHTTVGDLDPFVILDYKNHVEDRVQKTTLRGYVSTMREFLRFCNRMDVTDGNLAESIEFPSLNDGEGTRDTMLDFETIEEIEAFLDRYEYGQFRHIVFGLLWHTGCRMGALRSLDLDDYTPASETQKGVARLQFHHRPKEDTPLKNGLGSERTVNLKPKFASLIEGYIDHHRKDVTDDYGRFPLVTTSHGRPALSTIQGQVYSLTRPCVYSGSCPHGYSQSECEATEYDKAPKCPSSVSPHPLRRGSITYHLKNEGWTYEECSLRFNVSVSTLKDHYDQTTQGDIADVLADRHFS
jgi:site-specific recombinase XerD